MNKKERIEYVQKSLKNNDISIAYHEMNKPILNERKNRE